MATQAPDDLKLFYQLLQKLSQKSTPDGEQSPLKSWSEAPTAYVTAACAAVWGLPLQKFWETQGIFLNGDQSTGAMPISRINDVLHVQGINTSDAVVSPNTQVLYSNAWLDLSRGGVTLKLPDPEQREGTYTMAQLMDPYTNVQYSVQNSSGSASFYWLDAPASVQRDVLERDPEAIGLVSPQAWLLTRTLLDPYQNQDGASSPSSPYLEKQSKPTLSMKAIQQVNEAVSVTLHPDPVNDGDVVSLSTVQDSSIAKSAAGFFSQLNAALESNGLVLSYSGTSQGDLGATSELIDQQAMRDRLDDPSQGLNLQEINDPTMDLSDEVNEGFAAALEAINLISASGTASERSNFWTINTTLGQYSPNYQGWITAAAVAHVGLGANLAAYGTYPSAMQDSEGNPLQSHLDYQLDFASSGLPPVEESGFWSLTVYQDDQSVVDNNPYANTFYLSGATPVDQVYSLGSVQLPDEEGSSLRLSFDPPQNLKRWLPLPDPVESPTFNAMLRLYDPTPVNRRKSPSILRSIQAWAPPGVTQLSSVTNGPLLRSKIIVDLDGDLRRDSSEYVVRADADGLFVKPETPNGLLISKAGRDSITGVRYNGVLVSDSESMVVSPLTTLDWILGELGGQAPTFPERWVNKLINHHHKDLFGRKPDLSLRDLHDPNEVSPHHLSRLQGRGAQKLALTHASLNHGLGKLFSGVLVESMRSGKGKMKQYVRGLKDIVQDLRLRVDECNEQNCAANYHQAIGTSLKEVVKSTQWHPRLKDQLLVADGLVVESNARDLLHNDAWRSYFSEQRSAFDATLESQFL